MIDYEYSDLFSENSIPKQILISFDGATLTNEDLYNQELYLEESLCSLEELKFGCCEAGVLKFKISDIFYSMVGKWLEVKMVLGGNSSAPFIIGRYKVDSDTLSADRRYREIVAYDAMHDIINSSAIGWYNEILPDIGSKVTMRQFRTSFIESFGLKQQDITLANDGMTVEKTIQVGEGEESDTGTEQVSVLKESSLSGLDVITKICEINGCFGHIGRDGKFHYIYLRQDIGGLYPSDDLFPDHAPEHMAQSGTGRLYPKSPNSYRIDKSKYISCNWKNFFTKRITKLQIRNGENDIGKVYPDGKLNPEDNCYIIEDNFLVYGKTSAKLQEIAENVFRKIANIVYMPFSANTIGNPCFEIGDAIRIPTTYDIVESYILQRTLKGIQALKDEIKANGSEKYAEKVNGVQSSIIQLKGKTNTLIRNVDETRLEMKDMERELSTEIIVTAEGINETIKNTKEGLETKISKTVKSIEMVVSNDKTGKKAEVRLLITDEGGTQYEVKADKIDLTGLVSFTNLEASGQTIINGDNIKTGSLISLIIDNGNGTFHVDENGFVVMQECTVNGKVIGRDGFWLQYTDNSTRPPKNKVYQFVQTGYDDPSSGGVEGRPFLNIFSPNGIPCIIIGSGVYSEDKFKLRDTPFFPNGAMIQDAYINSLYSTHKEYTETPVISGSENEGLITSVLKYHVIKSGAIVAVYGTYTVYRQKSGEKVRFILRNAETYLPTHQSVRTASPSDASQGIFTFQLSPEGFLLIKNTGSDLAASPPAEIHFRFDYVLFS